LKVNLISYTQPAGILEDTLIKTPTDLVSYCARVSNPSNQMNSETSEKLIKYLIEHRHWSPLEMVDVTMEIETTRDIARQMLRHRSFTFQEFCIAGDSKITTILPSTGTPNYISIEKLYERQNWKNYKNILLRVYDEKEKKFVASKLKEVFKTGKKECYKITLESGQIITSTKEHKFLTPTGFKTLEEATNLRNNGGVATISADSLFLATNGVISYQDKSWLKETKERSIENKTGLLGIATEAGVSIHCIRKWLKKFGLSFTKKEVASYTTAWNKDRTGYKVRARTKEQREWMKKITPKGETHHAFRGGASSKRKQIANFFNSYRKEIFKNFDYKCQMCKEDFNSNRIELHHIQEVSLFPEKAYDLSNVIPVHRECHMRYHGKTPMWKALREKNKGNTLIPRYSKIKTIEYVGEVDTYDLEVENDSHNYIANKFVVHNSQRYSEISVFGEMFEYSEARLQDAKNRQGSIEIDDPSLNALWLINQKKITDLAQEVYEWALQAGIAKEVARKILPEGLTKSRMYMKGSLRSWIHYLEVRGKDSGTQKEHTLVALEIAKVISTLFPVMAELK